MMTTHDLTVFRYETAEEMGAAAGAEVVKHLRRAVGERGSARLMLAAAPSQLSTLRAVIRSGLDFTPITCFHMDDYLGLPAEAPQGFGNWLDRHFISQVRGEPVFHRIDTSLPPQEAADRYTAVMGDEPFDVTVCGLGVNAHLAFNDPPADFEDKAAAKVVTLDHVSRQQQVDEGHFADLGAVPTHAVTVTIPRLLAARRVVCCAPGAPKRQAVTATTANGLDPMIPGTALKLHPAVALYVDSGSAPR